MTVTTRNLEQEFTEALDAIVEERGEDFVYQEYECVYVNRRTGEPSCLIGHAVARVLPELFDSLSPGSVENKQSATALLYNVEGMTPLLREALAAAQAVQDGRYTWGEAREAYHQVLDRVRQLQKL